jgi:acyl carrier protein
MNMEQFLKEFAACFEETDISEFAPATIFKELDEWDSLTTLAIIGMCHMKYNVSVTGSEIRDVTTIEDLYRLVLSKK